MSTSVDANNFLVVVGKWWKMKLRFRFIMIFLFVCAFSSLFDEDDF